MRKIVYLMVILFVVLGVEHLYDVYGVREGPVEISQLSEAVRDTFQNAGIYESECDIEGYFYYGSIYLSEEGGHELLSKLAGYIGVDSEYEYTRNRTDNGYESVLVKDGDSARLELKLITVEYEENESLIGQQQYLSVNLSVFNSVNSGFFYREKIARGVEKIMEAAEIQFYESENETDRRRKLVNTLDISVKGKIYGYMEPEKQKEIAHQLIGGINAIYIFDNEETGSYSLYAYTDEIDEYVAVGEDKININVVFNYNETENVTYIHIGSPIVNYDY